MNPFYNDPGFWGFMTAIVTSFFGMIRMAFIWAERKDVKKAKLDLSVENIKSDNAIKVLSQLRDSVAAIIPVVARHEDVVVKLESTVQVVRETEINLTKLIEPLNFQYAEFNRNVPVLTEHINSSLKEMSDIKTEIIEMRKGFLFVTTKKEKL